MIVSITLGLVSSLIIYSWGCLFFSVFKYKQFNAPNLYLKFLVGFSSISFIANTLTIFTGLGNWIYLLLLTTPILLQPTRGKAFFIDIKPLLPKYIVNRGLLVLCTILFGIMHAWNIAHPDTLTYQNDLIDFALRSKQPAYSVLQKNQYGYGGAWYPMAALFSFLPLLHKTMSFANLSLVWVALLFIVQQIDKRIEKKSPAAVAYILLLALTLWEYTFFRLALTSAAPDTIASLLGLAAFMMFLSNKTNTSLMTILCCTAVTIKLSTAPILLLIIFEMLMARRWDFIVKQALTASIILMPFFAKNLIATGYLIYPVSQTKVRDDPKTPSTLAVDEEAQYIKGYARSPKTHVDRTEAIKIANEPLTSWVPGWFKGLELPGKSMIIIFLIGTAMAGYQVRQNSIPLKRAWLYLAATIAGFGFWLYFGPAVRFGSLFLLAPLLLADCLTEPTFRTQWAYYNDRWRIDRLLIYLLTTAIGLYLIYRLINFTDLSSLIIPKGPIR